MSDNISRKKASILNLLFNYSNAIFAIINGLILMPMYLKYFSIGTYGSFLSSGNIVAIIGLLDGGMAYVLTQKLAASYSSKNYNSFSKILGSGFFISFLVVLLLLAIGIGLLPFISIWVKAEPIEYRNIQIAFFLSAFGAGLGILFHNVSSVFQALLKVKISGYANIISIVFGVLSTILGLRTGLGIISIPLGLLIRNLVGIIILFGSLFIIFKKEKFPVPKVDLLNCRELLKSVIPMFGGGVAKSLVTNSQLIIITTFINPSSSAIYFITSRIFIVCDSFLAPISSSIFSSITQIFSEGDRNRIVTSIIKVFKIFNLFSAFLLATSFVMNSSFITLFLGKDKFGGNVLSGMLCINMLLYSRVTFLSTNLYALGVFGKTVLFDMIGGVVKIILIFLLIKHLGFISVPIAELIATVFLSGYYLNKLIIEKLGLIGSQKYNFIFLGFNIFLIATCVSVVWVNVINPVYNWQLFIFHSSLFSITIFLVLYIFIFEVRQYCRDILSYFKNKVEKIWM